MLKMASFLGAFPHFCL